MAKLNDTERVELLDMAISSGLRHDMRLLRRTRHNPALLDGQMDLDRLIAFLTEYNEFINHEPRPFAHMVERDMKM
jgi:hypothetical protein